ncbi:hypothetical protein HanHA300_Chr00c0304g0741861 [Helianthus annuus]|nr:hypothetical protein HanHA89_Chr09g0345441 [Helianthus annuus]KAJ0630356.1 hypothetical protein HanHA300_Chr00c0304g0741861 [Helianthus annuus]KAJ0708004.1 hypothetical protein HanLR1_Chr09g0324771 [Helianthus annuus]
MPRSRKGSSGGGADLEYVHAVARASAYSSFAAGAALIAVFTLGARTSGITDCFCISSGSKMWPSFFNCICESTTRTGINTEVF